MFRWFAGAVLALFATAAVAESDMSIKTATLIPFADATTAYFNVNPWAVSPDGPAYVCLDEGFLNQDGDATRIFNSGSSLLSTVLRMSPLPRDFHAFISAKILAWGKGTDGSSIFFQVVRNLDFANSVFLTSGFIFGAGYMPVGQYVANQDFSEGSPPVPFPPLFKGDAVDIFVGGNPSGGTINLTTLEVELVYSTSPWGKVAPPTTSWSKQ